MRAPAHRSEALFGAAVAAVGIFVAIAVQDIPVLPNAPLLGPRLFPLIAGVGMAVLGLATVAASLRGSAAPGEASTFDGRAFGHVLLGLVVFGVLVEPAGFVAAAAALFVAVARGFGARRWLLDAAIGLALAGAIYVVFNNLLGLSLPAGDWLDPLRRG